MTDNMDGFWSSVVFYCSWKDSIYFIISFIYLVFVLLINKFQIKNWFLGINFMILSYLTSISGIYCMTRRWDAKENNMFFNPISITMRTTLSSVSYTDHVKDFSIIHSLGFIIADWIENTKATDWNINNEEVEIDINPFINKYVREKKFNTPLILILVESLEDWSINKISTPHLFNFLNTHHCLHVHRIKKQTVGGTSADGQMIMNTGLLPISQGAACFRFPTNKYPSIGECSKGKTVTIIPHEIGVWNQQYMSPAYAYDTTIIRNEKDSILFNTTIDCVHQGYNLIQTITMSSHSPFLFGASRSKLQLPDNMPKYMSDYLKSIHYMDAGLNVLLSQIENDTMLLNATIVITGDHTIFPDEKRLEYSLWCINHKSTFNIYENYVPLIIYSPQIKENIQITDTCYQMDIYPTIMHLIGCEDYYWKGFGVNLLDSTARQNRPISEKEAYELSDKLIRSNYFATLKE